MKKKNHIKIRFSTILLFIPAILLCTTAYGGELFGINYNEAGEYDVTVDEINFARAEESLGDGGLDWLHVGAGATVNLYADVSQYIYAYSGSVLNIYSGNIGLYIIVMPGEPKAAVTVYGTDFAVNGEPVSYGQVAMNSVLTGTYGNGDPINLKVYSSVPIYLQSPDNPQLQLKIDIKPGGNPNNINLRSNGVVPVAVLTTNDFEVSSIDPTTVEFAGAEPVRITLEDVDEDGDLDMLFHFKTQDLVDLDENSTEATLTATLIGVTTSSTMTGGTSAGEVIQGTDEVCIKSGKKKK